MGGSQDEGIGGIGGGGARVGVFSGHLQQDEGTRPWTDIALLVRFLLLVSLGELSKRTAFLQASRSWNLRLSKPAVEVMGVEARG